MFWTACCVVTVKGFTREGWITHIEDFEECIH